MRMKGYDYSLAGAYFVTIATFQRQCLFGAIIDGKIYLNSFDNIASEQWVRLQNRFYPTDICTFVIMPNHVHGIIHIVRGAGEKFEHDSLGIPPQRPYNYLPVTASSLGVIVRAYKASVTYRINAIRGFTDPPVWQRNYYDHIIRNDQEFENITKYIEANPETWMDDRLYS